MLVPRLLKSRPPCDICDKNPDAACRGAIVATPPKRKCEHAAVRADGLEGDAGAFLDLLRAHGPQSYGAVARALGRGATRAWRAKAALRAAGQIPHHEFGMSEAK